MTKPRFLTYPEWVSANPELRDEVRSKVVDGEIKCPECNGTGVMECECHCGDVHDTECDKCDGNGTIDKVDQALETIYKEQLKADMNRWKSFAGEVQR